MVIVCHIYVCDSLSQYNDDESESNERVSIKNLEKKPNESILFSFFFFLIQSTHTKEKENNPLIFIEN